MFSKGRTCQQCGGATISTAKLTDEANEELFQLETRDTTTFALDPKYNWAIGCSLCQQCVERLAYTSAAQRRTDEVRALINKCTVHTTTTDGHSATFDRFSAPFKGGRMIVMRHSYRADDGLSNSKVTNPEDPPLDGRRAPARILESVSSILDHTGPNGKFVLYVSPYKRCLQTACGVARLLRDRVRMIVVDYDVRELDTKVEPGARGNAFVSGQLRPFETLDNLFSPEEAFEVEFLSDTSSCAATTRLEDYTRFQNRFKAIRSEHQLDDQSTDHVLVITHGDAIGALGELLGKTFYNTTECSWASIPLTSEYVQDGDIVLWGADILS
jgi:broad specificity phosphatase PhoE